MKKIYSINIIYEAIEYDMEDLEYHINYGYTASAAKAKKIASDMNKVLDYDEALFRLRYLAKEQNERCNTDQTYNHYFSVVVDEIETLD